MRLSLIITTYNWPAALNLTFASLARQSLSPDEVIVADDGSGAQTADLVQQWSKRLPCALRHIWQEDSGFRLARSRNRAIVAAAGDYIVLIDGDMILHHRFIEDHANCSRRDCFIQGARPQLSPAATQRLLQSGDDRVGPFTAGLERRAYAIRSVFLSRFTSRVKPSLAAVQGCNQSFWREHAIHVNGYDERFCGWGFEDREFAARLLHSGLRRNYVRHRAIACHLYHPSRAPQGSNPLEKILDETLRTRAVRCPRGIDQHLELS